MKKRTVATAVKRSWPKQFEYIFLCLPFLALIPNFFRVPELSAPGLVTQQLGYYCVLLVMLLASCWQLLKADAAVAFTKADHFLLGSLGLFITWQAMSLTWAIDRAEGIRLLGYWCGFFVLVFVFVQKLHVEIARILKYLLMVVALLLVWSLFYEYSQYGAAQMMGIFFNHGITAELLAILLPFFLTIFLFESENRKLIILSGLMSAFTSLALLLTLRRSPILGVLMAGLTMALGLLTKQVRVTDRWRLLVIGGIIFFLVVPAIIYKREAILMRLRGAVEFKQASTSGAVELGLTSRATMWLTALEMGKRNTLRGVGQGSYPAAYGSYRRYFVEHPSYQTVIAASESEDYDEIRSPLAHSEYLQIFAELGIVGLLLYAVFWWQLAWRLWRKRRSKNGYLAFGALCSLIAFATSSLMSAFAFRITPGILVLSCVLALGWSVSEPLPADGGDADEQRPLPRAAMLALLALLSVVMIFFINRSFRVYASQQIQSGLDFRFVLDDPIKNEALAWRYQQALKEDPNNVGAHLGYATLLFQMKRLPECLEHVRYAYQHSYNRPYTALLYTFALEQSGRIAEATQVIEQCVASFPKSIVSLETYAELLSRGGQLDLANQQRARAEKINAQLAQSWALALRMKIEDAAREAEARKLLKPDDLRPHLVRSIVMARAYHYLR